MKALSTIFTKFLWTTVTGSLLRGCQSKCIEWMASPGLLVKAIKDIFWNFQNNLLALDYSIWRIIMKNCVCDQCVFKFLKLFWGLRNNLYYVPEFDMQGDNMNYCPHRSPKTVFQILLHLSLKTMQIFSKNYLVKIETIFFNTIWNHSFLHYFIQPISNCKPQLCAKYNAWCCQMMHLIIWENPTLISSKKLFLIFVLGDQSW